jgi:hypothetical protein
MTMCYGPFLLSRLPFEAVETEAQCLDALDRFARLDLCLMFREIIKDRVVEFHYDPDTRTTSHRWLEGAEADPVLQLKRLGNCVPASWMETLDGIDPVLLPKVRGSGYLLSGQEFSLELATGHIVEFSASKAIRAVDHIRYTKNRVKQETDEEFEAYHDPRDNRDELIEFYNELLRGIEKCRKAGVIYIRYELFIRMAA